VAGAIAGLLLGSKAAQERRAEIQAELVELKDTLVERLQTLKDFTQDKYDEAVTAVLAEYVAAQKIPADQARELETMLREGYAAIHHTICEHAGGSKVAAKPAHAGPSKAG
jgi:predicted secreted protein